MPLLNATPHGARQQRSKAPLIAALLLVALPLFISAQKPSPANDGRPAPQRPAVLKVVSREVVVDVTVTDTKMQPVRGLKAQDFEVLEDGRPQHIVSFTAHELRPQVSANLPKLPKPPPGVFTNFDPVPANSPLNIILIDLEDTPRLDIPYVRQQTAKFLLSQPRDARYAVFVMGGGMLSMIQGFTSDKDKLIVALNSKELSSLNFTQSIDPFTFRGAGRAPGGMYNPVMSGAASPWNQAGAPGALGNTISNQAQQTISSVSPTLGTIPIPPEAHALLSAEQEFSNREQVGDAASELAQLSAFLRGLPGRKNLFWFSGSFPISYNNLRQVSDRVRMATELERQLYNSRSNGPVPPPDYSAGTGTITLNNGSAVDGIGKLLAGSRTSVFAIDARGLETVSPRSAAAAASISEQYAEDVTLDILAKATGGRAFYNTNGFKEALSSAVSEGANYYTLSYSPTNTDFKGGWRNIRVVLRGHAGHDHLSYERGYFATSTNGLSEDSLDSLDFTLQHGAPAAQQILFWAFVAPVGNPFPETPKPAQAADPSTAQSSNRHDRRSKPRPEMIQDYFIRYAVTPSMIQFESSGSGQYAAKLELAVRGYNSAGRETASYTGHASGEITPASYASIKQKGLLLSQKVALPTQTSWLRLAVYDLLSHRVGSLEVRLVPPVKPKGKL